MRNTLRKIKKNNKGFTMVELIVVLVLMLILLSIAIFGGLAWQDWSRFQHEDSVAEEIFFAAQNQLIEYDSSGAMERKFVTPLKSSANYNSYVIASSDKTGTVTGEEALNLITDSDGTKYEWSKIWDNSKDIAGEIGINANIDTVERSIITLSAASGDFDNYQQYKAATTQTEKEAIMNTTGLEDDAILLFDLVATYISDSSVLNGAIVIELSPEAGQVLAVCYSDRADSFVYGDTSGGSVSVLDRTLTTRENNMIGYYSAGQLTEKIKGRGVDESNVRLEIRNGNVLEMVVHNLGTEGFKDSDEFEFTIYNGENTNDVSVIEGLSLKYEDIKNIATLEDANTSPVLTTVKLKGGKYSDQNLEFRFPVWVESGGDIHIVLDAADIQAGTSAYKTDAELKNGQSYSDANKAFRNTFSFFRFGLTDVNYIYASVKVTEEGGSEVTPVYSVRKTTDFDYVDHRESAADNGFYGECTAFKSLSADENDSNKNVYEIDNGRHFYNMRYVTEKKTDGGKNNVFKLVNDIDWKAFTGGEGSDGNNYFLDSYPMSAADRTALGTVGIDYEGYIVAKGENKSSGIVSNQTQYFDFPGFRCLGKGDEFTQDIAYGKTGENGESSYTISNLNISFTANVVYGVYDDVIGDAKDNCLNGDFSGLLGLSNANATDSSGSKPARAGELPLGLFCENLGTISKITLNKHVVKGIETFKEDGTRGTGVTPDQVVCTNMVGGFAGNNLGTVEELTLLDFESNDHAVNATADLAGKTKISGRTDVGGIIGRESFVVSTNTSSEVELKDMKNYGTVTGMENVGGIVGRAYVLSDTVEGGSAKYYHDGYSITDDGKSMTGVSANRVTKITIEDCTNRGAVSGDVAFAGDSSNNSYRCAFIGGIAGTTMDGAAVDRNNSFNIKVKNCDSFSMEKDVASRIVSAADTAALRTAFKALDRDYYVGGLVGYARLTAFEDINTTLPSELKDNDGASESYVMGAGYVGGIVGCADFTRFDKAADASADSYAATNYNNVIGKAGVGGIAGGFGRGGESTSFSFRNPASNSGSVVSDYEGISYVAGKDLLNSGVVLALKSNKDINFNFSEYAYKTDITGACGGIAGVTASPIENCDNIQSAGVKKLMTKLISGSDSVDFYSDSYGSTQLPGLFDTTKFGGNAVGGIIGYAAKGVVLNEGQGTDSKVDAIVFGQDKVGGFVGFNTDDVDGLRDMYPTTGYSGSKGMLVLGRDEVGGIIGELRNKIWNNHEIDKIYTVKGCYGVGGIVGANSNVGETNNAEFVVDPDSGKVKLEGIGYVGGYLGISDKRNDHDMSCSIQLADMDVTGKCFVGGLYGAVVSDGNQKLSEINVNNMDSANHPVKVDSTVSVKADAYAGGVVGLYSIHSNSNDYTGFMSVDGNGKSNRTLRSLDESISGNLTQKFNGIANANIGGTNNFAVGSTPVSVALDNNTDLKATVEAKVFAGGMFGYVPEGVNITVDGFTNRSNIVTTETVKGNDNTSVNYSYLGSVIGRVPSGMTVTNCHNTVSGRYSPDADAYYDAISENASYIGGLTEVNAGVITGKDDDERLVNELSYDYNGFDGTIGAFAGVNGTKAKSGATIQYCENSGMISAKYAGGIAGAIGGSSSISNSVNSGDINAVGADGDCGAAGIVYEVQEGVQAAAGQPINIKSNVNAGTIRAAESYPANADADNGIDTKNRAGIVYNTRGQGTIELCRNYAAGLINGITSKETGEKAKEIHYCLDASQASNHIGDVLNDAPTQDMFMNFYMGKAYSGIPYDDPGEDIVKSSTFVAYRNYGLVTAGNIDNYSFYTDVKTYDLNPGTAKFEDISKLILSISPDEYNTSYKHNDSCFWSATYPGNDQERLGFVIIPVDADSEKIAYASMNSFSIVWDNYGKTAHDKFFKYVDEPAFSEYVREFNGEVDGSKLDLGSEVKTLNAIAAAEYDNPTDFAYYKSGQNGTIKNTITSAEQYQIYAEQVYLNHKDSYSTMSDSDKIEAYKAALFAELDQGKSNIDQVINYINGTNRNWKPEFYNVYIDSKMDGTYDSLIAGFNAEMTISNAVSFRDIADAEYYNRTDEDINRGYNDKYFMLFYNNNTQYYSYFERFAISVYGYLKENNIDSFNSMSGAQKRSYYLDKIYAMNKDYNDLTWHDYQNNLQFPYTIIATSVNSNDPTLESKLYINQINVNISTNKHTATFNFDNLNNITSENHSSQYVQPGFDYTKIKQILVVVTGKYNGNEIGLNALLWTTTNEQGEIIEPEAMNTIGGDSEEAVDYYKDAKNINEVIGIIKNSSNYIKTAPFIPKLDETGAIAGTNYRLYLVKDEEAFYSGIDRISNDPLSIADDGYKYDYKNAYATSIRKTMFEELDNKFVTFINTYK